MLGCDSSSGSKNGEPEGHQLEKPFYKVQEFSLNEIDTRLGHIQANEGSSFFRWILVNHYNWCKVFKTSNL